MKTDNSQGVTVVIPCFNEEKYIERCVNSILEGTSRNIRTEILIIDGMSHDDTAKIVDRISHYTPNVRRIINPQRETQIALNIGVRNAVYDHVMIAGAHTTYPDNYIETLLSYITSLKLDGAGGSIKTDVLNKTKTSNAIIKILSHPAGVGNSMFRIGSDRPVKVDTVPFGIYKRELFDEVGYYNEKLKRNHDMEWSKRLVRAGKKIYLIPEKQCTYYARETYSELAQNNYQNGMWNILAVWITRTFRSLSFRHFVPFLFVGTLLISALAGIFFQLFFIAALSILLLYLLAVTFFSVALKDRSTTVFHMVWGFVVLHFSYGTGSMVGIIKCITGKRK